MSTMTGLDYIIRERQSHSSKGYDADHDDDHDKGEMAVAAAWMASPIRVLNKFLSDNDQYCGHEPSYKEAWPKGWGSKPKKKDPINWWESPRASVVSQEEAIKSRIDELARAGSLCASEIDRLLRQWSDIEMTRDEGS
jgi:hypothetical protein